MQLFKNKKGGVKLAIIRTYRTPIIKETAKYKMVWTKDLKILYSE